MSRGLFMLAIKHSLFYEHIWTIREFPCIIISNCIFLIQSVNVALCAVLSVF